MIIKLSDFKTRKILTPLEATKELGEDAMIREDCDHVVLDEVTGAFMEVLKNGNFYAFYNDEWVESADEEKIIDWLQKHEALDFKL